METIPFIDYVNEDKSQYRFANTEFNKSINESYIDADEDFLIGNSGGFLMNIDFKFINVHLFTEVAEAYSRNILNPKLTSWIIGLPETKTENRNKYYYCPYLKGTIEYDRFWSRETIRRRNGMTAKCKLLKTGEIVDLHITGDHYNYLNYSRIQRTPTKPEREYLHSISDYKTELIGGFPRFWDGDYWNFKTDLFIARNKFHLTKAKARGKGYSNKRGSQSSNTVNLVRGAVIVLAADIIDYLTDKDATGYMVKRNLDWFEDNTHWKRGYVSENLENLHLGYKTRKGGNKIYGYDSKMFCVSLHNNESAAIGKRALEIDFEESGKLKNLRKALNVTMSSTEVGAGNVGTIRAYGTAGTKNANWADFAYCFYNPNAYQMMPFENVWDNNSRHAACGFFHPQVWNMEPFMDKDGNSLLMDAYEYDLINKENAAKNMTISDYLIYVGQRANSPEEAFKNATENIFSSPELDAHVNNVRYNPEYKYYRDGMLVDTDKGLVFKTNKEMLGSSSKVHPFIEKVPFDSNDDVYGCIREYYPPFRDRDGIIPKNLYYAVYDTVGKDKDADTIINKNSLNSINVMMFPNNISNSTGDILVASYAGRPPKMEQCDRIFLKLLNRYNCKGLPEVDRGETVHNFTRWRSLPKLYKDPTKVINDPKTDESNLGYGVNMGGGDKASQATEYLAELLYTPLSKRDDGSDVLVLHHIKDLPFLLELQNFTKDGNFDRISSMRLAPLLRKYADIKKIKPKGTNKRSIYDIIGLYGYKDKN